MLRLFEAHLNSRLTHAPQFSKWIIRYEYRTADTFLKDFALMKSNAIKFNGKYLGSVFFKHMRGKWLTVHAGSGTLIAEEGAAIDQVVKDKVEESRGELTHLEEAVEEQMSSKPKKRKKKGSTKASGASSASFGSGVGDLLGGMDFNIDDISDSDSDWKVIYLTSQFFLLHLAGFNLLGSWIGRYLVCLPDHRRARLWTSCLWSMVVGNF
jgi:hypothetical protein